MAVNSVLYGRTLTADTDRGFSESIWASCPMDELRVIRDRGQFFEDDFDMQGTAPASGAALAGSVGRWSTYMYQGGQINDGLLEGGVIRIGSDGDNEGVAMLGQAGGFRFLTTSSLALNQKMWFEARVARSSIASAHLEAFVGLMKPTLASGLPAAAQPITVTDDTLMTAGDLFGFHLTGTSAPTEVGVKFVLASGTVNAPTNLQTLMASTGQTVLAASAFVKLGWIFDPGAAIATIGSTPTARQTTGNVRKKLIRFFVNGLEVPTFLSSDDVANATATQAFPTAFMCPVIAVMNQASQSSDYLAADWIRVAQYANS